MYMRRGPRPNKSSRKESNLHGGISRPARKQGADNSMSARGLTVPPGFRSGIYHASPPDARRRREIKRIQKFKSTTWCARARGRFSRRARRRARKRRRVTAEGRPGHFPDRVDTILTVYTPVSLHGATKWKYEKRRVRAVVSRAIVVRAQPPFTLGERDCSFLSESISISAFNAFAIVIYLRETR